MANVEDAMEAFEVWLSESVDGVVSRKDWLEDELTHGSPSDCFYELMVAFRSGYCAAKTENTDDV